MAVLKRGLVIGGVILGGILALAGIASAAKGTPSDGGGPPDEDPYSPEACAAYKNSLYNMQQTISSMNQQQVAAEEAALMAAQAGDQATAAHYSSIANDIASQKAKAIAQRNELETLISRCA